MTINEIKERLEKQHGKILNQFIRTEREKMQRGSGDDLFYELQVEEYINKQRTFWLTFIDFLENKFQYLIDEKDVKLFTDGIINIWYKYPGTVDEKIEQCVKLFRRIRNPETDAKYIKILDDYDGV